MNTTKGLRGLVVKFCTRCTGARIKKQAPSADDVRSCPSQACELYAFRFYEKRGRRSKVAATVAAKPEPVETPPVGSAGVTYIAAELS